MGAKAYLAISVFSSVFTLTGCQTADLSNQATQTIDIPVIEAILDSDGDGIYDELDACPDTDRNSIANTYGCPLISHTGYENINKSHVLYLENSSEISVIDNEKLDSIVKVLREYPESVLLIEAHIGKSEYVKGSDSLARSRAERLKNHMITNYNVDPERTGTYYCSYYRPIAPNDDPESRHKNQRAEIELESVLPESIDDCERFNY